jgi:streptogramin lyase
VAVDSQGNVYFADEKNNAIKSGAWPPDGDVVGFLRTQQPGYGVAVDSQGNVYFSDAGHNAIKNGASARNR